MKEKVNNFMLNTIPCFREQLRMDWAATQERIKNEEITITYSYWDGSGHRRSVSSSKIMCMKMLKNNINFSYRVFIIW